MCQLNAGFIIPVETREAWSCINKLWGSQPHWQGHPSVWGMVPCPHREHTELLELRVSTQYPLWGENAGTTWVLSSICKWTIRMASPQSPEATLRVSLCTCAKCLYLRVGCKIEVCAWKQSGNATQSSKQSPPFTLSPVTEEFLVPYPYQYLVLSDVLFFAYPISVQLCLILTCISLITNSVKPLFLYFLCLWYPCLQFFLIFQNLSFSYWLLFIYSGCY